VRLPTTGNRVGRYAGLTFVLLAASFAAPTGEALAQTPTPLLRGVVVDSTGVPVPQADLIAIGATRQIEGPHYARADDAGRFVFPRLEPGSYTLTVRRIGFVPTQASVVLVADTPRNIRVEIQRMPQVLADVVVEAPAGAAGRGDPLFRGVIVDSAGRPIVDAEVVAGGDRLRSRGPHTRRADPQGRFAYEGFQPGRYFVTVRRIGYVPIRVALTFEAGTPRNIRFELQPMPQHLADIEVRSDGFDLDRISRRVSAAAYGGTLITRDDLERMAPRVLGDAIGKTLRLVRPETFEEPNLGFSHLWVRPGNDQLRLRATGFRGRDCPPAVSVNGRPTRAGWAINDFPPEAIEAIEIYRRTAPFPFDADPFLQDNCGNLVIIWRRAGMVVEPGDSD